MRMCDFVIAQCNLQFVQQYYHESSVSQPTCNSSVITRVPINRRAGVPDVRKSSRDAESWDAWHQLEAENNSPASLDAEKLLS